MALEWVRRVIEERQELLREEVSGIEQDLEIIPQVL